MNQYSPPSPQRVAVFAAISAWKTPPELLEQFAGEFTDAGLRHHLRKLVESGVAQKRRRGIFTEYRNKQEDFYGEQWRALAKKEGHMKRQPVNVEDQRDAEVHRRRMRAKDFITENPGMLKKDILKRVPFLSTNDFGWLRVKGHIHSRRDPGNGNMRTFWPGKEPEKHAIAAQ